MNNHGATLIELMMAVVIMGLVVKGTYEGIGVVEAHNGQGAAAIGAQTAVAQAALELENLAYDSPALRGDGNQNDLGDLATPDYTVDPATGAAWTIPVQGRNYGIVYNVVRDTLAPNSAVIKVYATWNPNSSNPLAGGINRLRTFDRTVIRSIAP